MNILLGGGLPSGDKLILFIEGLTGASSLCRAGISSKSNKSNEKGHVTKRRDDNSKSNKINSDQ